jgi:uncharacterized protein (TIGR03083 family)
VNRTSAGPIERHRRACDGFARVADAVQPDRWERPTPCAEWDAGALVEHVIGFHEVLLLRPMGVRAHRPRTDPAARWAATQRALFDALTEPVDVLPALTTDVLVHTWDLARAVEVAPDLDLELCESAYEALRVTDLPRDGGMFAAAVPVAPDADAATRLVAFYGRDPAWRPS